VVEAVFRRSNGAQPDTFQYSDLSSEIFEEQLNGWYRVPAVWPEDRELHTFLRWFECGFHSVVVDACDNRLRHSAV
jgi:hypothetical protein